jgi:hypothetical protein
MVTFRQTTRVGGCMHCGGATVQACAGCERFVCASCEQRHAEAVGR